MGLASSTLPSSAPLLAIACPVLTLAVVVRRARRRKFEAKQVQTVFRGKVVWITGASSGIGRSLALAFAQAGAKLILSARREAELIAVAAECDALVAAQQASPSTSPSTTSSSSSPPPPSCAKVLVLDLATDPAVLRAQAAGEAQRLWGAPVDVLVNNGGISSRSPAEETTLEVDSRVMAVNFLGPVALTKGVLPRMLQCGGESGGSGGHLVVISSVQGRLAIPFRTSYAAAKHALHGFFESLRAEIADRHVKVTMVLPGYVKTSLSLNAVTGKGSSYAKMDPTTAKGMDPDDLAAAILAAVATGQDELLACDAKTKAAVLARALLPDALSAYMAKRAAKGWKELKQE